MKLLELFLIVSSTLAYISCTTPPSPPEIKNAPVIVTKIDPILEAKKNYQNEYIYSDPNGNFSHDDLNSYAKYYSMYCKDLKQIKSYVLKLSGIIVPPVSGMPLDEADEFMKYQRHRINNYISDFFKSPAIFLYSDKSSTDLQAFLNTSQGGSHFKETNKKHAKKEREELIPVISKDGHIFISIGDSNLPLLGRVTTSITPLLNNYIVLAPLDIQKEMAIAFYTDEATSKNRKGFRSKSKNAEFDEAQIAEFRARTRLRMGKWNGFFNDETGKFSTKYALNEKSRAIQWNSYFMLYSHVKEASTNDPNKIDFEVSADLSTFCAYARPISDFYTK